MEELFDTKNISGIASKLVNMQQSLKLLVNVHDYEDHKLQLEGLKNRLEAIASPLILQAFTTNNAGKVLWILYSKHFNADIIYRTSTYLYQYIYVNRKITGAAQILPQIPERCSNQKMASPVGNRTG